MTYGLYQGIGLKDDFPKFKSFEAGNIIPQSGAVPELSDIDVGDGLEALLLSILLWIGLSILLVVVLVLLEAIFWVSIFILLAMMYWVFFRALKLVFTKSPHTKGDIGISAAYALAYTALYTGWIFGITYLTQLLK